jgi:hypothetical protein
MKAKQQMMERIDCDDVGEMKEYIGCKIDRKGRQLKITQPVLLQSFIDEFDLPNDKSYPNTPAEPRSVLMKGDKLSMEEQCKYRSGVGKLLYLMRWSRPEIMNSVRELSRFMQEASKAHLTAMYRVMKYCVGTPKRGLMIKPTEFWDGDKKFEFIISGRSDSDFAKDVISRKSVSGCSTFLCGAPVCTRSKMQDCVTLSVTEAELVAATQCAQDMLFVMRVLESMDLKVRKPMILEVDNKGAKDLAHNWTIGGRTRHVDVKYHFLRELKENGIILVKWISQEENSSDLFTKNLATTLFKKHAKVYCSDEDIVSQSFQGEGVIGASIAYGANDVSEADHMPDGIDHMPDRIDHMPDRIDHMPDGIDHMPGGIDHMPDGIDHMPDGMDHMPGGIDYMPDRIDHMPNGIDYMLSGIEL